MKLVLFRHAERENSGTSNPPLSARGIQQAKALVDLVQKSRLPLPQRLICSPKLRTHMTFIDLASHLKISLQIRPELDERSPIEDRKLFANRVRSTLGGLQQQTGAASLCTFICTHVDWLEAAMQEITCETDLAHDRYLDCWAPGHFMIFDTSQALWTLEKMETLSL